MNKKTAILLRNAANQLFSLTLIVNILNFNTGTFLNFEPKNFALPDFENLVQLSSFLSESHVTGVKRMKVVLTAYSSTPDQTDDTPFITASNSRVRDGIVAANFLPFGTKIMIPDLFGEKIFVVEDRMHKRFSDRVDIWFSDRWSAKKFGIKEAEIVIIRT